MEVPGFGTTRTATPRQILATLAGALYLPGGKVISGANSRDPNNGAVGIDAATLRAGMVMGMRNNDEKYAPSIIGLLTVAGTAAGATITTSAAAGDEVARRITAGGIFKVVGPPTDGGTVAVMNNLSFSAEAAGVITLAANVAVAEVQTCTIDALMTAGTYTYTYKGYTTAAIAFNASNVDQTAALELLPSVTAGDITPEAANEPDADATQTFTFANTLGNVPMLSLDISNCTGPTTVAWAETTPGELVGAATLGADCAIGSMIMPADGSEAPKGFIVEETGIKVTDIDSLNIDAQLPKLLIGGIIKASQIIDYSADSVVRTWLKNQFNAATAGRFTFDDDFGW